MTTKTKMTLYNPCVISALLYECKSWTTYSQQEKRLDVFHLRGLRKILGISWQDHVTNADALSRAGLLDIHSPLRERRLRWPGHIRRMEDGRIRKTSCTRFFSKFSTRTPLLFIKECFPPSRPRIANITRE